MDTFIIHSFMCHYVIHVYVWAMIKFSYPDLTCLNVCQYTPGVLHQLPETLSSYKHYFAGNFPTLYSLVKIPVKVGTFPFTLKK